MIICPKCKYENSDKNKVCAQCATPLKPELKKPAPEQETIDINNWEKGAHSIRKGETISDRYKIHGSIGSGAMGEVFKAYDSLLEREIAIKTINIERYPEESLRKELKERFIREGRTSAKLNHPNIVTVHDAGEHEGIPFIAMELIEGESLRDCVKNKGKLPLNEAVEITGQICDGLAYAHDNGIIHRDLKPGNIMLTKSGQVKIMDFGLAKPESDTELTQTGRILGTASYMSPEQAQGKKLDNRSDLFSLGIILYEMLTGEKPFTADSVSALLIKIINQEPQTAIKINPDIPKSLNNIILKALSKPLKPRYQSAKEFKKDLSAYKTTRIKAPKRVPAFLKRARYHLAYLGAAIIISLVLLYIFTGRKPEDITPKAEATPSVAKRAIAVMYFENLAGDKESEWLRAFIPESINTSLGKLKDLHLLARETLLPYKDDKGLDIKKLGQDLGVEKFVFGSYLKINDRLQINSRIVDAATGLQLESHQIKGSWSEVMDIIPRISQQIATDLGFELTEYQQELMEAKPTEKLTAFELVGKGIELYDNEEYNKAILQFDKAIDIDPDYSQAHYYKGLTLQKQNQHKKAISEFQQALKGAEEFKRIKWRKENCKFLAEREGIALLKWSDNFYAEDRKERLIAADAETGKTLWEHKYVGYYDKHYAFKNSLTIIIAHEYHRSWYSFSPSDIDILCFNIKTGSLIWSLNLSSSLQETFYKNLFISAKEKEIIALDIQDGRLVWKINNNNYFRKYYDSYDGLQIKTGGMTVINDVLLLHDYYYNYPFQDFIPAKFYSSEDYYRDLLRIKAIEVHSGEILWEKDIKSSIPLYHGEIMLFLSDDSNFSAIDHRSGKLLYRKKLIRIPFFYKDIYLTIFGNYLLLKKEKNRSFFGKSEYIKRFYAFNLSNGKELWSKRFSMPLIVFDYYEIDPYADDVSSPRFYFDTFPEEFIIQASENTILGWVKNKGVSLIDLETGDIKWSLPLKENEKIYALYSFNEKIIAVYETQQEEKSYFTRMIETKTGKVNWQIQGSYYPLIETPDGNILFSSVFYGVLPIYFVNKRSGNLKLKLGKEIKTEPTGKSLSIIKGEKSIFGTEYVYIKEDTNRRHTICLNQFINPSNKSISSKNILFAMGESYFKLGNLNSAKIKFEEIIDIYDPSDAESYKKLYEICNTVNNRQASLEYLQKAIKYYPEKNIERSKLISNLYEAVGLKSRQKKKLKHFSQVDKNNFYYYHSKYFDGWGNYYYNKLEISDHNFRKIAEIKSRFPSLAGIESFKRESKFIYLICGKYLFKINAKTGKEIWRFSIFNLTLYTKRQWLYKYPVLDDKINAAFAIDDKNIYLSTKFGLFFAINKFSGKKLWTYKLNMQKIEDIFAIDNKIYVILPNKVLALDSIDGQKIFEVNIKDILGINFHNGSCYVSNSDKAVKLDSNKGNIIWENNCIVSIRDYPKYKKNKHTISENKLYIATEKGEILCFSSGNGELLWKKNVGNAPQSNLLATKNNIYIAIIDGFLYCLNKKDGSIEWRMSGTNQMGTMEEFGILNFSNLLLFNGNLYTYNSFDQNLYIFKTDLPSKLISTAAKIEPWDPPVRTVWPPKRYYFYWFLLILLGLYLITAIFRMTYVGGKFVYKRAIKKKKA